MNIHIIKRQYSEIISVREKKGSIMKEFFSMGKTMKKLMYKIIILSSIFFSSSSVIAAPDNLEKFLKDQGITINIREEFKQPVTTSEKKGTNLDPLGSFVASKLGLIKNLEKSYNKRYQASLIENSRFVQGHGLEHFMEQQKIKYTCPKCGGIISIHDKECSECQEKMK